MFVSEPVPGRGDELVNGLSSARTAFTYAKDGRGQLHVDRLPAAARRRQRHLFDALVLGELCLRTRFVQVVGRVLPARGSSLGGAVDDVLHVRELAERVVCQARKQETRGVCSELLEVHL